MLFDELVKSGNVNIRGLVLREASERTARENQFLTLYLKYQFASIFSDIEKQAIETFVKRLTFAVYMPGQVIAKQGQQVFSLLMFIEGKVVASNTQPENKKLLSDDGNYNATVGILTSDSSITDDLNTSEKLRTYRAGDSFGEECFQDDEYRLPFNLVCKKRAIALTLRRKDFAEMLL